MTTFTERQRAELRDAAARSRLEAQEESRRLTAKAVKQHPPKPPPAKPKPTLDVLQLPEAQEIIRRIGANVDPDYPHRAKHVAMIAAVCVRAKLHPTNTYARPTL